ncbi:hypothetical protein OGM63_13465 [Plectonema radiosum NIES-515]|uniref:Uncharacterized protein n=1 Tax=Plectonema radiosum NIES-515 TaxID=2986073 RepID=A0ABT3AZF4_9CYAN|nr:hypothetical protein [Plectonema radiosum]MCV3214508.1 hypothetical protein [Plectonema radiosum NIES-515]
MRLPKVLLTFVLLLNLFQNKAQAVFHDYQEIPGRTNDGVKLYLDANHVEIQKDGNRRFHYVVTKTKPTRNSKYQLYFDESASYATGVTPWCRFGKVQKDTRLNFDARVAASPSWIATKTIVYEGGEYEDTLIVTADSTASKNLLARVCNSEAVIGDF